MSLCNRVEQYKEIITVNHLKMLLASGLPLTIKKETHLNDSQSTLMREEREKSFKKTWMTVFQI